MMDLCVPQGGMLLHGLGREKPKHSKDIARITFDVYKENPRDLFGSLNVKATFYGLYSMSCDFQGVGPKKVLRSENRSYNPTYPQALLCEPLPPPQAYRLKASSQLSLIMWFALTLPFRELLRWTSSLLQGLGHILLGISSTLRHVVEGAERWQWHKQSHLHS